MTSIITGIINKISTTPNRNNWGRTNTTRMTLTDKDGTRYCGTRPLALKDAKVGDKVAFTAETERSPRIKQWFWFKRPRAATVVDQS